jgi:capsular polysaccharide biosynthesis protein
MTLIRDIRDIATHLASQHAPRVAFHEVAPAGRSLQRPPLFMLGPVTPALLYDLAAQLTTPRIGCYELHDALVAPTGIPIKQNVAFHGEAFLHPRHLTVAIADRLNAETPPIRAIDGTVALLTGPGHETYGHWLVDFLPRLWVLHQAGHDPATLRYMVPADLRPFGLEILRLCGIRDDQIVPYRHWQELPRVERLLLPTGLRLHDRLAPCLPAATAFWAARLAPAPAAPAGTALYLRRAGGTRTLRNRDRIEAMAVAAGFTMVQPETLTVPQQIALFAGARIVAGEYGSALHNAIFAGPGATICALRGTARHPSLVQSGIATALGQNLGYVFGPTDGAEATQSFTVDEANWALALEVVKEARRGLRPSTPLGAAPPDPRELGACLGNLAGYHS